MGKYPELHGQRVLITGAASGIGKATLERFAAEGARVAALDRDSQALSVLTHEIPSALTLTADVSVPEEVQSVFSRIDQAWGGLDILIANAGISLRHSLLDITVAEWQQVLAVNLTGVFLCAQQALKRMVAAHSGRILLTASTNGYRGHAFYADYNASKAGVILLAKTIAVEYAPHVLANAVCPGYVLTPMQKREYTAEMLQQVNANLPLKRHAEPSEVASLFAFLASDDARYITGQCVTIDGGETI
ncbi:MAG: oxidoreductase [Sulfobacillus acidophilus]|uniref:Oxidoreductase n=1 Tax=Sulfobacillus acidophilus TaxID=53633 RepID=A0A2T2WGJ3_9FIRM|nr:MAG: oxidoreductase [Sulfobacillus acidophilus]